MKSIFLFGLAASALCAQTVQVYSEFAQINDAGEVIAPENPREILSPAVARNAFSTFQIAIQVPEGTKFLAYVGENPDNAAKVMLYRRRADKLVPSNCRTPANRRRSCGWICGWTRKHRCGA